MSEESKVEQAEEAQFQIHKIYIKDISFEIPEGAEAFKTEWKPELNIKLNAKHTKLSEKDSYEVILTVNCSVVCDKKESFKSEVQQAGIFTIANLEGEQLDHALKAFCPNILYPYAREAVSDMVAKGGFPQLCLAPVNFDMLYQQQKEAEKTEETTN
ncbi:protein-export chaperone SecB [Francisellaceae bacterium]|nr:protein-export chaperone SecB [Francisellaceae bacterium]